MQLPYDSFVAKLLMQTQTQTQTNVNPIGLFSYFVLVGFFYEF